MHVAVVNLTSGGLSGGYRKYLSRLMPLLASDSRIARLTVFVPAGGSAELDTRLDIRSMPGGPGAFSTVARQVVELAPDVVFVPTARTLDAGGMPLLTMVRNMEPLTVPFSGNAWSEGLRNMARAWEARRACRRATRVIAVSNYVRTFVISKWGLDPGRVATVYHGVDRPPGTTGASPPGRTLFTAGSIRPARGLDDVIRVLPLLDPDVELVIAGRVDAGCEGHGARLGRLAERLGVARRITWAGQLDPGAMARAFTAAVAFVMTSRAEACPNTALEAMSCGTASVSVEHAPMPEFFTDAALYYPAGNVPVLARQLRNLLDNPAQRDELRAAASRRAADFSWAVTKERTVEELEHTIG
jgi:glycosyltransferase involved in cell wall biosynthesis